MAKKNVSIRDSISHLLAMPADQFANYKPKTVGERIAYNYVSLALDGERPFVEGVVKMSLTDSKVGDIVVVEEVSDE